MDDFLPPGFNDFIVRVGTILKKGENVIQKTQGNKQETVG
jgi:hypothetical protein